MNDFRIIPIGTSRIHEPLSFLNEKGVIDFPGFGYFHSPLQIIALIKFLSGELDIDFQESRFFFRKDQTPGNLFQDIVWNDKPNREIFIDRIRSLFENSNGLLIEISTLKNFIVDDLTVQGNPNYYNEIPYSEVWKSNYYNKYHPEVLCEESESDDCLELLFIFLEDLVAKGKKIVIVGHLVDPLQPNSQRLQLNNKLRNKIELISAENIKYYDASHLIAKYGFRVLEDDVIDVHHLPWEALEIQSQEILQLFLGDSNVEKGVKDASYIDKGVIYRKQGKHAAWQARLNNSLVKTPNDIDLLLEVSKNYYESCDLLNCLRALDRLAVEFNVDIEKIEIVEDIKKSFKLRADLLEFHGLVGISRYFLNDRSERSGSEELKKTIDRIEGLKEKTNHFFEKYDWFSASENDPGYFSALFTNNAMYNPRVYNYLQVAPFEINGENYFSYLRCMFRLGRSEEVILNTSSVSVGSEYFYRELALSDQGLQNISCINEDNLLNDYDEYSRLSIVRNRVVKNIKPIAKYRKTSQRAKVALMISGQLRGYRDCVPLWIDNLKEKFDLTVFMATWSSNPTPSFKLADINRLFSKNTVGAIREIIGFDDEKIGNIFSSLAGSTEIKLSDLSEFALEENIIISTEELFDVEYMNTFGQLDVRIKNQMKMFYKIFQCYSLAKKYQYENGSFDLFVRMRPDLGYFELSDKDVESTLNRDFSVGVLLNQVDGVDDKFALLNPNSAELYSAIWGEMLKAKELNYLALDRVKLAESLVLRNIYAKGLNPFLLRNTSYAGLNNGSYSDKEVLLYLNSYVAKDNVIQNLRDKASLLLAELN